jgi:hypothetical protein
MNALSVQLFVHLINIFVYIYFTILVRILLCNVSLKISPDF